MPKPTSIAALAAGVFLTTQTVSAQTSPQKNVQPVYRVDTVFRSTHLPAGQAAFILEIGPDTNGNGVLDSAERNGPDSRKQLVVQDYPSRTQAVYEMQNNAKTVTALSAQLVAKEQPQPHILFSAGKSRKDAKQTGHAMPGDLGNEITRIAKTIDEMGTVRPFLQQSYDWSQRQWNAPLQEFMRWGVKKPAAQ